MRPRMMKKHHIVYWGMGRNSRGMADSHYLMEEHNQLVKVSKLIQLGQLTNLPGGQMLMLKYHISSKLVGMLLIKKTNVAFSSNLESVSELWVY